MGTTSSWKARIALAAVPRRRRQPERLPGSGAARDRQTDPVRIPGPGRDFGQDREASRIRSQMRLQLLPDGIPRSGRRPFVDKRDRRLEIPVPRIKEPCGYRSMDFLKILQEENITGRS